MNRMFVIVAAVLLATGLSIAGAPQEAAHAEKLLASAQHKAAVDGDLKSAIDEYKKALAAAGGHRALAAQALLGMAECHQKRGEAEAQAILQRVIRDYADQKDAVVVARSRLNPAAPAARVKGDRSVWTGREADGFGTISPDGRFLTYTDWHNGAVLVLRNLTTGSDYRLTAGGTTQFSAISKDGRQVAYEWTEKGPSADGRRYGIRVARLLATEISNSRWLFQNDDVTSAVPCDWSPDGKWIATTLLRKDGSAQVALLGVQDGTVRVLKSTTEWNASANARALFFSSDGRYLAFGEGQQLFVMPVDASSETLLVDHPSQNTVMGWSPDGQYVLFSSDRSGSVGLWAAAVKDGKAAGTPMLVKPDVSSSWSLGMTSAGTMYVWKYASPIYIQASSIDPATGKLAATAPSFQRFITSRGRPAWSGDGRYLAYQSCNSLGAGPCNLWIRSMDTGELRELKPKLGYFGFVQWSPDARQLLTRGRDPKGRNQGLYRIDAQTGEVTLVASPFQGNTGAHWAPDGNHVYYRRGASVLERDLALGAEREVARIPTPGPRAIAISPDGRHVAYVAGDALGAQSLFVMPIDGGAGGPAVQLATSERAIGLFDWTSDGRALSYSTDNGHAGPFALWIVDIDGRNRRQLDLDVSNWLFEDGLTIDRAGKQIAFVASSGPLGLEIRALENFLPKPTAKPAATK